MKAIFHLHDPSTDFLKPIYEGMNDILVVRGNIDATLANRIIDDADQVIMMGHGSPDGLFGRNGKMLIGKENVENLSYKRNNIYIWCHASTFVVNNELQGFSTGMFISEVGEALFCLEKDTFHPKKDSQSVVQSNDLFARVVREALDENLCIEDMSDYVKRWYQPSEIRHPSKEVLNYNAKLLTLIQ